MQVIAVAALGGIGLGLGFAPRAGTPGPVSAPAAYKVDPIHSTNVFRIRHNNVANFYGRFNEMNGTVNWDDADPGASSIKIEIPVASVDTGKEGRNNHLKSPDFFNAAQFPTMTFASTSFSKSGDNTFKVSGDLTIHGVTMPVTAELVKTGTGKDGRSGRDLIGLESTFDIKRSDFGMDYGVANGVLGDDVRIIVAIEAGKQ